MFYDLLFLDDSLFRQWNRRILIAFFHCTWFPVIQFMGDTMAFAALREAGHHTGWMRCPVTALAGRNRLVLVLMTGNTQY